MTSQYDAEKTKQYIVFIEYIYISIAFQNRLSLSMVNLDYGSFLLLKNKGVFHQKCF